jgi:hypothetical protein
LISLTLSFLRQTAGLPAKFLPSGRLGKAKFLKEHSILDEDTLRKCLLTIINQNPVSQIVESDFGVKYIVEGPIKS